MIFKHDSNLKKGTWKFHGLYGAVIACPDCGMVSSLSHHIIEDDGNVAPSLVCVNGKCGFHQMGVLLGWRNNPTVNINRCGSYLNDGVNCQCGLVYGHQTKHFAVLNRPSGKQILIHWD